jgi:nucleoid-associated protein YgaU
MKTMTRISFLVALILCAAAAALTAQSLLDNGYYYSAKNLQTESQQALEAGEYDKAASLAVEAREYLARSDEFVADRTRFYRANGWLSVGNERLAYAKDVGAEENFAVEYAKASSDLRGAKLAMDMEEYETSVILSKSAIDALKDVQYVSKPEPAPVPTAEEPSWPQYYEVRLIQGRRDCFWRIAEYPFVYGDPWKWKLLYEANKGLLSDPANPDLIEPGQVFEIPSLAGEKREGAWDPGKKYPPLP